MKIWDQLIQGSEEWFAVRRGRPTASNFSKIITAKGMKLSAQAEGYAYQLLGEIVRPDEPEEFFGSKDTDRGNELEPLAREEFMRQTKLDARTIGFCTRDDEVIGCSPDSLVYVDGSPIAGLEIKCPRSKKHLQICVDGGLPDDYKIQVHGSMAVTGLKAWYFMSYCQGIKPHIHLVRADETTAAVSAALDEFLFMYADIKLKAQKFIP